MHWENIFILVVIILVSLIFIVKDAIHGEISYGFGGLLLAICEYYFYYFLFPRAKIIDSPYASDLPVYTQFNNLD